MLKLFASNDAPGVPSTTSFPRAQLTSDKMGPKKRHNFQVKSSALSLGGVCFVWTINYLPNRRFSHWLLTNFNQSKTAFEANTQNKVNHATCKGKTNYARKIMSFLWFHFV